MLGRGGYPDLRCNRELIRSKRGMVLSQIAERGLERHPDRINIPSNWSIDLVRKLVLLVGLLIEGPVILCGVSAVAWFRVWALSSDKFLETAELD